MAKVGDFDFYCEVALQPNADIVKVYESQKVLAFHHTKPSYEKHIVVIPKEHPHDLTQISDSDLLLEILTICRDIIKGWDQKEVEEKGARIVSNLGRFQDTPHVHFHVVLGKILT